MLQFLHKYLLKFVFTAWLVYFMYIFINVGGFLCTYIYMESVIIFFHTQRAFHICDRFCVINWRHILKYVLGTDKYNKYCTYLITNTNCMKLKYKVCPQATCISPLTSIHFTASHMSGINIGSDVSMGLSCITSFCLDGLTGHIVSS
jgi:hypothetical protein